ncbi:MAG: glycosyltransferase family 1 protein, partial [Candidatus Woesearchaeota archaeon]|nr:glycosyltransferase family 1 protein [Candidatus Woesearchaeota archaeon]
MGGLARYEKSLIYSMHGKIDFALKHASEIKKPNRFNQILNFITPYTKINKGGEITHLLNQQLALSLNFVRLPNTLVTIHDLAFLPPKYHRLMSVSEKIRYYLVKKGLSRVYRVIVDAPFTKNEVIKYLDFPKDKIDVVPLGIDHSLFKVKNLGKKRAKYRHYPDSRSILYVGSETPRMNFHTLLMAFYELKKSFPDIKLLKVGESKCPTERKRIMNLIYEWGIEKDVKFIEHVSEEDLINYYNSVDLFVYPIEYTGFGLPPLEAMACGCPV